MSIKGYLRYLFKRTTGRKGKLPEVGSTAPSFATTDCNGKPLRLEDLRGKWVVFWFFPKADTPG